MVSQSKASIRLQLRVPESMSEEGHRGHSTYSRPLNRIEHVDRLETDAVLAAVQTSVTRGRPFGSVQWQRSAAAAPGPGAQPPPPRPTAEGDNKVECPLSLMVSENAALCGADPG